MSTAPPTDEELRKAFARIRKDTWTVSFEAYSQDPIHSKLLKAIAIGLRVSRPPEPEQNTSNLQAKSPAPEPSKRMPLDRRRLAAGEKESDFD